MKILDLLYYFQVESRQLEDVDTGNEISSCRYFKLKVLKTHKKECVEELSQ